MSGISHTTHPESGHYLAGISYVLNEKLVRGLDYYSDTVFEWITRSLGAQGTICAGGRYDSLVSWLGGKPCPASGFAMGMERLVEMLASSREVVQNPHVYFAAFGDEAQMAMMGLAERLRDQLDGLGLVMHCGGGSAKSQFKKADRSGAQLALVMGDEELAQGLVTVKHLRDPSVGQQQIAHKDLPVFLARNLALGT